MLFRSVERANFEKFMRAGPREFSWFIFRVTNPTMREFFMAPQNPLRMKEALLTVLAGDIYGSTPYRRPLQAFEQLDTLARAQKLFDDPGFVDRYTQLKMDLNDLGSLYQRYVDKARRGEALGPDISMLKVFAMDTYQKLAELLLEAGAEYGAYADEITLADEKIDLMAQFYTSRPGTIYGGSNEIQRNILSKYVLQLPG